MLSSMSSTINSGPFVLRDDDSTYFRQFGVENVTCFASGVDPAKPIVNAAERKHNDIFNPKIRMKIEKLKGSWWKSGK